MVSPHSFVQETREQGLETNLVCFILSLKSSLGHLSNRLNFPEELKHLATVAGVKKDS